MKIGESWENANPSEISTKESLPEPQPASTDTINAKDKKTSPKIPSNKVNFDSGDNYNNNSNYDIVADSEDGYRRVVEKIVSTTDEELKNQSSSKNPIKRKFTLFFAFFISIQYLVLAAILILLGLAVIDLSETIIITYMTSVFAETLGAVIIMIRYAFSSNQEVELIKILSKAVTDYKKFNEKE